MQLIVRLAGEYEPDVGASVFLNEADELMKAALICEALHRVHVEHIGKTGIADGEDLLYYLITHHRRSPSL